MAVTITTSSPQSLLAGIKLSIDQGHIVTWSYDSDGDFIHTAEQWKYKAWLRPIVKTGNLTFGIIPPRSVAISREVYAIYHGRFIEMLLVHFDEKFSAAIASAMPTNDDDVGS